MTESSRVEEAVVWSGWSEDQDDGAVWRGAILAAEVLRLREKLTQAENRADLYENLNAQAREKLSEAEKRDKWLCLVHGHKALPVCGLCISRQLPADLTWEEK